MHTRFVDDPRLTAVGLLVEVYGGLIRRLDAVHAANGLTGTDFDVLIRLVRSPAKRLRMTDLATQTALSTSGITRIVDRLESRSLVARQPCMDDRRSSWASLTDSGQHLLDAHLPGLVHAIDEAFVGLLTTEQLDGFLDTLGTMRDALHPGATAGADI
ncbi:MarR family winged helix-turn-helix transcriptional regulator [Tenggerimyces flavus]|uniref:MarR family winged helix-turn-helix transcriptional regulator n=1 Tax=Tenggerimyces flavus TaxID=1708749 RepID=A0ABV7YL18_9ACTN|nr:MarR family transcriptional regulator [Tenggerimyces flavus]MBM7790188.1 DNA-binding MarR family transcriptional regulator [Tenggerimyces flavus]